MFTSEDSVDGGVRGQARLPSLVEDPSIGQVLREEEPPEGEDDNNGYKLETWTEKNFRSTAGTLATGTM